MSDLSSIEVELLGINTEEKFLAVRQKIDFAKGLIRTLEALLSEKGIELIESLQHPIASGDLEYRIVTDKSYKAKEKPEEMAKRVLETVGPEALFRCLASGCIKHGQLREELEQVGAGEMFSDFFELVEKKTIEGKPVKKLAAVNKLFAAKSA